MVVKANVLNGRHFMDVLFSVRDKESKILECGDPDCYLALGSLIRNGITFINGGDKPDSEREDILLAADYQFGSRITFFSDDAKKFISIIFWDKNADVRTHLSRFIVDNSGMISDESGVKMHLSVPLRFQCPDLVNEITGVTLIDMVNDHITFPSIKSHSEMLNTISKYLMDSLDEEVRTNPFVEAMSGINPNIPDRTMALGIIAMICGPVILLDNDPRVYVTDDRNTMEVIDSVVETTHDFVTAVLQDADDDDAIKFLECYQPDYPKTMLMFPDNPEKHTNMFLRDRMRDEIISKTIKEFQKTPLHHIKKHLKDTPFATSLPDMFTLAIQMDSLGNVIIHNEQAVRDHARKMKTFLGLDEADELPTIRIGQNGEFYCIDATGENVKMSERHKKELRAKLHDLGINISFGEEDGYA